MTHRDVINTITFHSCVDVAIQCVAAAGITDWQTAFDKQITNAKKLGLMPADFNVMRETLQSFGFILQGTAIEGKYASEVLSCLCKLVTDATVFLQVPDYMYVGGYLVAVQIRDGQYYLINLPSSKSFPDWSKVSHVWIHWSDGIDKSPYPRQAPRKTKKEKNRKPHLEAPYYKPFQPNPFCNNTGDCVVRAIAGVMDISWNEVVDMLAEEKNATVNLTTVYSAVLRKKGFVHHHPLVRNGRRLDGKAFCEEMNKLYHNGERILAHVGRLHVAAIVPSTTDGKTSYTIMDSWNSSKRLIGEYWVWK